MSPADIAELFRAAQKAGKPIAYVNQPIPGFVRIVFKDGHLALSEHDARVYMNTK